MTRIRRSNLTGVKLRWRPRMGWIDRMKRALNAREMSVEQGKMIVCDRSKWKTDECFINDAVLTTLGGDSRTSGVTLGAYQV